MEKELGIYPQEGINIFEILLSEPKPQMVVSVQDLNMFLDLADTHKQNAAVLEEDRMTTFERPALNTTYVAPQTQTQKRLGAIYSSVLGIQAVGIDDNYFELGGDSLLAVQIISKINVDFNLNLPIREFFSYRTIRQLAGFLDMQTNAEDEKNTQKTEEVALVSQTISLAPVQKKFWMLDKLVGSQAYNFAVAIRFCDNVDSAALEQALQWIVDQNDALRMSVTIIENKPCLKLAPHIDVSLQMVPCQDNLQQYLFEEINKPIHLDTVPLFRMRLISTESRESVFLFVIHHIIFDGWSKVEFFNQLISHYKAITAGASSPSGSPISQYRMYSTEANALRTTNHFTQQRNYWVDLLNDVPAQSTIPPDYMSPSLQAFEGQKYYISLGLDLTERLTNFSKKMQCSLYTILMAAHILMIHKYTGQTSICVGSPVSGRNSERFERTIGLFANTVVIRAEITSQMTVRTCIEHVNDRILGALNNQDITFDEILDAIQHQGDMSRNPLFQTMLIYHNIPEDERRIPDLKYTNLEIDTHTSKFDMTVELYQSRQEGLHGWIEYSSRLYREQSIEFVWLHYKQLLSNIMECPDLEVSRLSMLHERDMLMCADSTPDYSISKSILQLFNETVKKNAKLPAIYYENEIWDFNRLDEMSDRIAGYLNEEFKEPGQRILVYMDRSPYSICALWGIWKASHIYVPIDFQQSSAFLDTVYKQAGCSLLLFDKTQSMVPEGEYNAVDISQVLLQKKSCSYNYQSLELDRVFYLLYTSGSVSVPKGVKGLQQGLIARSRWMQEHYPYSENECVCHKTSIGFIDALNEVVTPLLQGIPLLVLPYNLTHNLNSFVDTVSAHSVTRITLIPSLLATILDTYPNIQEKWQYMCQIIISGEPAGLNLVAKCKQMLPNVKLINIYGCTECSGDSSYFETNALKLDEVLIPSDSAQQPTNRIISSIPIGRQMSGMCRVRIIDDMGNPSPVGSIGEIVIGGPGTNKGYWQENQLTKQTLFHSEDGIDWYKTGDLGRLLANGQMEYLNRKDRIYKRNGIRIDINQIEAAVLSCEGVSQAVIRPYTTDNEQNILLCYFVAKEEGFDLEILKRHLRNLYHEFYLPNLYIQLKELPLLPNGKVDYSRLRMDASCLSKQPEHKLHEGLEQELAEFWLKIVNIKDLCISADSLLMETGGNSLMAIQLLTHIEKMYSVKIPFSVFLKNATIRQLAREIETRGNAANV